MSFNPKMRGIAGSLLPVAESGWHLGASAECQRLWEERGMQPAFFNREDFTRFAKEQADLFGREPPGLLRLH